ncbi:predicted protein [Sclerotinia sclerotiorum 1980 UF-70]|uniref:Uncharacterized protein n=1 Tax=Sclerotinia sclerotiorum (strain ATCC 18683 / 1980 / Ss-1) TaxID=665079 RepID=A7F5V6_SCLS1|nr:predicted protein [Sclerotinia sclerotiorum 1980 UF-70]EDN98127.1 predicted protein [Sclerotinia sclerotiorum 1980 UF-70]
MLELSNHQRKEMMSMSKRGYRDKRASKSKVEPARISAMVREENECCRRRLLACRRNEGSMCNLAIGTLKRGPGGSLTVEVISSDLWFALW